MANEFATFPEHDVDPVESPRRRHAPGNPALARASRQRHRRIRIMYFTMASMAGFVIGSAALLGGLALFDPTFYLGAGLALLLLGGAVAALLAGMFVAVLYRGALGRKGLKGGAGRG